MGHPVQLDDVAAVFWGPRVTIEVMDISFSLAGLVVVAAIAGFNKFRGAPLFWRDCYSAVRFGHWRDCRSVDGDFDEALKMSSSARPCCTPHCCGQSSSVFVSSFSVL